jgi:hypothetical protein
VKSPIERRDQQGHPISTVTSTPDSVTVSEVLIHCLGKPPHQWAQQDQNRVARCLQILGYTRHRVGPRGAREYRYLRQKTGTPIPADWDIDEKEGGQYG